MELNEFTNKLIGNAQLFNRWVDQHEFRFGTRPQDFQEWLQLFSDWMENGAPITGRDHSHQGEEPMLVGFIVEAIGEWDGGTVDDQGWPTD